MSTSNDNGNTESRSNSISKSEDQTLQQNKNIEVDYTPFLTTNNEQNKNNDSGNSHELSGSNENEKFIDQKTPANNYINNDTYKSSPLSEKNIVRNSRSNSQKEPSNLGSKRPRKNSSESQSSNKAKVLKGECDHCRRRQTQCVQVPNLKNCVQCESKGIKCTYSEIAANRSKYDLEQIKKRVDENVNVHDLLKRTKLDQTADQYQQAKQMFSPGNGNIEFKTDNVMTGGLDPNLLANTLGSPNGLLSPEILNSLAPMNNNNAALASALNTLTNKNGNTPVNNNVLSELLNNLIMNNQTYKNNNQQLKAKSASNNEMNFQYMPKNVQSNGIRTNNSNAESINQILSSINQSNNVLSPTALYSQLNNNKSNNSNTNFNLPHNGTTPNRSLPNAAVGAPSYPRSSFYLGPTSLIDYNLINHVKVNKIDQIQISPTLALRKVASNVQFLLRDDFNEKLYLKQEQELDLVEKLIHPYGKTLVDIFFKVVHPHYPILHEKVFMEKYSRSYKELTTPLLASIYCLALDWWEFHPQLIGFPKPDVKRQLMDIAIRSFFEVVERPKLSIVQAGLLILKCRSETSNNWVIASEVVALAEELGLGIDCQDWRLPKWERGLRRRLAWAVWSMEKWTSASEGRFSHLILGRNWLVKMLSDEDFPNDIGSYGMNYPKNNGHAASYGNNNSFSGTPNTNLSNNTPNNVLNGAGLNSNGQSIPFASILDTNLTPEEVKDRKQLFQNYVSLSIVLGEILDTFYTLGAMSVTNNIEYVLKLAKPLQLKLKEWYQNLPPNLSINHLESGKFNSNAALTLAYFGTEICLHRKILTTLDSDKSAMNSPELKKVCREAANSRVLAAIDFVEELKPEHINGFWYSCSSNNLSLIGSFIALLYCTSETSEEKLIFRNYLKRYIYILRTTLANFQKAKTALEFAQLLDEILI
ncbi:hypothetical protein ACO0R3_003316 [Hanseniaspora guilliermondii]